MADERQDEQERRLSVEAMPDAVRQLVDTMLGINPHWSLEEWLVEQANLSMDLLAVDLLREKMMIDQRLQRLDDLGRRLESNDAQATTSDPHQRNLFDCFDLNEAHPLRGLGERAIQGLSKDEQQNETESHPSNIFLDLLPHDNTDDPLLAIACQSIVMGVEAVMAGGEPVATLEDIFKHTRASNIEDHETDEALDHLLTVGLLLEVDDDCFILLPS
ncbi:MAG: hypothetical protein QF531_00200 [Candidatus Poseidonia sp.]|nr:hypothetical protein [Poseidonia sp.]